MASNPRRSGDPRRRAGAVDPLKEFAPGDMCWCASGKRYRDCHQIRGLAAPGAPLPPDTEDAIYIAPNVAMARDAFSSSNGVAALTNHFPRPQLIPAEFQLPDEAFEVRGDNAAVPHRHDEIGALRYATLDANGLADADRLRSGALDQELLTHSSDLLTGAIELARESIARLTHDVDSPSNRRPVVLHHDCGDVSALVGQTLLWADHYTTSDPLAELALSRRPASAESLREAVLELLRLRPLIEAGIVVPLAVDIATSRAADAIDAIVAADLANEGFFAWVEDQVVVEGPTAREAAFVHVVDDSGEGGVYFRGQPDSARARGDDLRLTGRVFGRYDPNDDYKPWLRTVQRQAAASLTRTLGRDLAIAEMFGSNLITRSPFRARALRHRNRPAAGGAVRPSIAGAVWAQVPWLPDADAALLVRIAANTERVEDLRAQTEKALRGIEDDELSAQSRAIAELSKDLSSTGEKLGRELRKSRAVELGGGGLVATGSTLIGATLSPPMAGAAALAAAGAAIPTVRADRRHRRSAAYAFWMARPR